MAVLVHGGCWLSFATLRHFDHFAEELTARGLATWNISYRKVDEAGGEWPGTFHDVAAGVDHVRALAEEHDLAGPAALEALVPADEQVCGIPVIDTLLGGSPEEVPERYAAASPARQLPLAVAQLHIVGAEDEVRPLVETFADRARETGDAVAVEVVSGAGHHDVIATWSAAWSTVPDLILDFVAGGRRER